LLGWYILACTASEAIPGLKKQQLPGTKCGHGIGINVSTHERSGGIMGKAQPLKAPMEKNAKAMEKIKERLEAQGKTFVDRSAGSGDQKRKVGFAEDEGAGAPRAKKPTIQSGLASSGLSRTIHELLDNYVPASSFEPTAFFCRICKHTASNEEEFLAHKASELHRQLQHEERKRSECRLCRKQFTSPDQLKEHLRGNKHKEKLANTRQAQQQQKKFC
jgi:hypothetical protein